MVDNIVDFDSRKQSHLSKRKEAKVDALRQAFREARGEPEPSSPGSKRKRSRKSNNR
jgi:hypothetical protein